MDNVDDISQMTAKFKRLADFREYSEKLVIKLQASQNTIHKLQEENAALKKLLENSVSIKQQISSPNIKPEILLCEMEILRLKEITTQRPLSLEETKKFSILVNDLLSIQKAEQEDKKDPDHTLTLTDEASLLKLVKSDE